MDRATVYAPLIELLTQKDSKGVQPLDSLVFEHHGSFAVEFLAELANRGLQDLEALPKELDNEKIAIENTRINNTIQEYQVFLSAAHHVEDLAAQFATLPPGLEKVLEYPEKILAALEQCGHIKDETIAKRNEILLLSRELEHLEPILEIPALFDTLLRNGHHEEAMDLQLYTQRLPIRYPNIPYLTKLANLETNNQAMLVQLISMLKGPVKLPLCIRVIGYLRRLGYEDTDLRILFLSLRNEHLSSLLAIVKESQPHGYVKRWIETQREHLFDIVTHYKAIFPIGPKSSRLDGQILASFAATSISKMFAVLTDYLTAAVDASALGSISTQVMYYGLSLGKIGMDFRPLAVPLFEDAVLRIVALHFSQAAAYYRVATDGIERPARTASQQELLMKSTTIAVLYNQYMNGLNQLRYLPLVALHSKLVYELNASIQQVVNKVVEANEVAKRDSEISAWILSDALIPAVFDGLDTILLGRSTTNYSAAIARLALMATAARNHGSSLAEIPPAAETTPVDQAETVIEKPRDADKEPTAGHEASEAVGEAQADADNPAAQLQSLEETAADSATELQAMEMLLGESATSDAK
ncbi:hypothetical protein HDV03_002560 [Kappamyces sp. JEL0829]|nr:hypothetical protein HDV03_002560 [Kappamyces sp. JEL0829]